MNVSTYFNFYPPYTLRCVLWVRRGCPKRGGINYEIFRLIAAGFLKWNLILTKIDGYNVSEALPSNTSGKIFTLNKALRPLTWPKGPMALGSLYIPIDFDAESRYVDFSHRIEKIEKGLIVGKTRQDSKKTDIFKPFTGRLWLATLSCVLLARIYRHFLGSEVYGPPEPVVRATEVIFSLSYFVLLRAYEQKMFANSVRLIDELPAIGSLKQLILGLEAGHYQMITQNDRGLRSLQSYARNARLRRLHRALRRPNVARIDPLNHEFIARNLHGFSWASRNTFTNFLNKEPETFCKLAFVPIAEYYSFFAFRKGFGLAEAFNRRIPDTIPDIAQQITEKYIPNHKELCEDPHTQVLYRNQKPLSMDHLKSAFKYFGFALFTCVAWFLLAELLPSEWNYFKLLNDSAIRLSECILLHQYHQQPRTTSTATTSSC